MIKHASLLFSILLIFSISVEAKTHRSTHAKTEFKHLHLCPSTGQPKGACPGWIIDHVVPLCAGGADDPVNMQWQTISDAKLKDRDERRQCRAFKR